MVYSISSHLCCKRKPVMSTPSSHQLAALLMSISLCTLAACQPANLPANVNTPGASASPQPGKSPSANAVSPTPSNSAQATSNPSASPRPNTPAVSLPGGVTGIRISAERTSFSAVGQQARLSAVLLDAKGQPVIASVTIEWASSNPDVVSINSQGLSQALANGNSEISARISGSNLIARLELSVDNTPRTDNTSTTGGGGGGGGVGVTPTPEPTTVSSTDSNVDPSADPSSDPSTEPSSEPSTLPAANEYRANSYTLGGQTHPALATDANGNFVMVWQSYGQDGDGEGVYAQRFNSSGHALGDEFRVNQSTTGDQKFPDVAMSTNGSFVITWQSGQSGDVDVYGRFYSNDGEAIGNEMRINTSTGGDQSEPKVASNSLNYIFTWTSEDSDGSQEGVYAKAYEHPGIPFGDEFLVNETTSGAQFAPDVAMSDTGAVIGWTSHGQGDGYSFDVFARRYNLVGTANGSEFRVNTTTGSQEWIPSVAMHDSGSFVLAWHSNGQDGDGDGIYARAYASNGEAASGELAVNQTVVGHQSQAAVDMFSEDKFIITWMSQGQDGDDAGIYARAFNDYGAAGGFNEYQVHTTTAGAQNYPAISLGSGGIFGVIGWASANLDGDSFGIYFSFLED
ncbi:MAG: hypothetical protein CVV27_10295 [Candidatus Melainabacteria bacterium HGW-Melainabacteria-1]|nr:MAG: hypothetical protein CVV27_10295 [Candidatus Melainabacteria bacterium HGW-Melainabacteria-1]